MIGQLDADYLRARWWKAAPRLVSYALFEGRPITTRGRWINPLVFALSAVVRRLPQLRTVRAPIYVVGLGRSGTTILGKLLSLHPRVGFLNEPKALWHAVHPEEDVIGNYTQGPARFRLSAADASPEAARAAHRLYGAYLLATASSRVVDKYADMLFRVPFLTAIFPDARFLLLVRDGWDTCASISGWSERHGSSEDGARHDWWGVDDRKWRLLVEELVRADPRLAGAAEEIGRLEGGGERAAVEWVVKMRQGLRVEAEHPEAVHRVRYEELVARPRRTLGELLSFCDLAPDERVLDYASRVLAPRPRRPAFALPPVLEDPFLETMEALGYRR